MTQVRTGFFNKRWYYEKSTVVVASGAGTLAILFAEAFGGVPHVHVLAPRGSDGTYTAASVTKTGFTLTVASVTDADYDDQDVEVLWFAHEEY